MLRYDIEVPDTLDLAGNADYAINSLTGTIKPEQNHEAIWCLKYAPLTIHDHGHEWFDSSPRSLEALTLLRTITGSTYRLDKEKGLLNELISKISEDGLIYNLPYTVDAFWRYEENTGARGPSAKLDDDVCSITVNAVLSIALLQMYERDGEPFMLQTASKLIDALKRIAIHKEDYAYYPPVITERYELSYYKKAGWLDTKEAESELGNSKYQEGATTCSIGFIVRALTRFNAITGDNDSISLAAKLVKYMLKPQFWMGNLERWGGDKDEAGIWEGHGGAQSKPAAIFKGHLSAGAYSLEALIDYAAQVNDAYIKEFVRQGYEYYRNLGLARIGCWGENIANSYLAGIAIKLSDSGAGDFWEDVDQYIRNQMVEDQLTDIDALKKLCYRNGFLCKDEKYRFGRQVMTLLKEKDENGNKINRDYYRIDIIKCLSKEGDENKITEADRIVIEKYCEGKIEEFDALKAICDNHGFNYGDEEYDLERFIGGLTHYNNIDRYGTLDPSSNMAEIASPYQEAMYFVWEGITRYNNGMAVVNLLLNRSAPWIDIDSYLPYEGKVIIKNKTASHLAVRIPKWVERKSLKCSVNGSEKQYYNVGNYITLVALTPGDKAEITFPMVESVETYYLIGMGKDAGEWYKNTDGLPKYTLHLRGNTCVKIEFPDRDKYLNGCYNLDNERCRIPVLNCINCRYVNIGSGYLHSG